MRRLTPRRQQHRGPTRADLAVRGPRIVFGARAAVVALGGPVGLLVAPPGHRPFAVGIVLVAVAWTAAAFVIALRCRAALPVLVLVADALVITLVGVTQAWTVSPVDLVGGSDWVAVAATATAAAYPWRVGPVPAAILAAVLMGAGVVPAVATGPLSTAAGVSLLLWGLGCAVLSGGQHHLIDKAAGLVDEASRSVEAGRRRAVIAKARADDERDHLAALHDTAATTLLLVGQGVLSHAEGWLADQAARDLEVLRGPGPAQAAVVDLLGPLRRTCEASQLTVKVRVDDPAGTATTTPAATGARPGTALARGPRAVPVPRRVVHAFCGSTREALGNAARHGGASSAEVTIEVTEAHVVVEIRDRGRGFAPGRAPSRGRGIAESIVGRMRRVGGEAEIASLVGVGTAVRLGWELPSRRFARRPAESRAWA